MQRGRIKILVLSLVSIITLGCGGRYIKQESGVDFEVFVIVNRQIAFGDDLVFSVNAQSYDQKENVLEFVCPCTIGEPALETNPKIYSSAVTVNTDTLSLILMEGAPYLIEVLEEGRRSNFVITHTRQLTR